VEPPGANGPGSGRTVGTISLIVVLVATGVSLTVAALLKQPCASGNWQDGRQYRQLCYTDIVPLYGAEQLTGKRLPYLDRCTGPRGSTCDEYPVLTMYFMRVASWVSRGYDGFFYANEVLLGLCALLTAFFLHRIVGQRALLFALAPSLVVLAFINWDLLAVALTAAATYAYLRGRERGSGILLGLGAAAKLYPALLILPLVVGRARSRKPEGAARVGVWSILTYTAVNFPFAVAATKSWSTFFRLNTDRTTDFDSMWYVACRNLPGHTADYCSWSPHLINVLSLGLLVGLGGLAWWSRARREPNFPRWTLGFPLIALFLLVNKVYSPQYSLWLLPWFALALPDLRLFALFEVADVAVWATRFSWFGVFEGHLGVPEFATYHGVPVGAYQAALVVRAAILVICVLAWVRRREPPPEAQEEAAPTIPAEEADVA
jgi:uncharacterized membrane protein